MWVLLRLRVPISSICVGTPEPRTESTHVIEPRITCALVGAPAPGTESTHPSACICVGTFDLRTESTHL